MNNNIKKLGIFYLALFGSILIFLNYCQILYNVTNSIPYKLFLVVKNSNFKPGDYIAISGHQTKYTNNLHFTKTVAAVPGNHLKVIRNILYVNNKAIVKIRKKTRDNRPLTQILDIIVPQGKYLVLGKHDSSFDARYKEFGLVKHENITGRAYPIF